MKSWLIIGLILLIVQTAGTEIIESFNNRALLLLWKRCILSQSNYFYIGSFLYIFKDNLLKKITRYCPIFLVAYDTMWGINHFISLDLVWQIIADCLLPILIVTLGYYLGQHRLKYDISYGIYLYHVMIINIFLELSVSMNFGVLLLIVLLSCACGIGSLLSDKWFRKILA